MVKGNSTSRSEASVHSTRRHGTCPALSPCSSSIPTTRDFISLLPRAHTWTLHFLTRHFSLLLISSLLLFFSSQRPSQPSRSVVKGNSTSRSEASVHSTRRHGTCPALSPCSSSIPTTRDFISLLRSAKHTIDSSLPHSTLLSSSHLSDPPSHLNRSRVATTTWKPASTRPGGTEPV